MRSTKPRSARGSRAGRREAGAATAVNRVRDRATPKADRTANSAADQPRPEADKANNPNTAGARAARAAHRSDRSNLYEDVTRRIIIDLESGRVPWVQPWGKADTAAIGLPRNAATGRAYSGINILILWGAGIERAFSSHGWLTFAQARAVGGSVRKGEHGTTIVYADLFTPDSERERARQAGDEARAIAFLKRFTVFNVAQIDGLPEGFAADPAPLPACALVPVAEAVIAASGVPFRIGGVTAFYAPGPDFVQVPPQPAFFAPIDYYRTCLHELTHATGHDARLGRPQAGAFGSADYAREELVAEMGAAFLCAALGIVPTVRHADYLAAWLDVLRADSRAIFRAASAASKAAEWLLARHRDSAPAVPGAVEQAVPDPAGAQWSAAALPEPSPEPSRDPIAATPDPLPPSDTGGG